MLTRKIYLIVLFFLLSARPLWSLRTFDIRWTNFNCTIMSKAHFGFFNCFIKDWPRNRGNYVTIHLQFNQNIDRILLDFKVSMALFNKKELELIKFRADGCEISKRKSSNPVITALTKQFIQSGNFSGTCPLEANTTYSMQKVSLIPDYFPGYTPEMNFTIKVGMFTDKIHLLAVNAAARVFYKK